MRHWVLLVLVILGCPAEEAFRTRPVAWAQPVLSTALDNWHRIDDRLWRSAQPDAEGMAAATAAGIRSVLNLRTWHDDEGEAKGTGLHLERIAMDAGEVTYAHLVQALRSIRTATGPVLVHCWHGSDRTGAVVAAYRIAVNGWLPSDAADEMANGGFGHHESIFPNLRTLITGLDPVRLRRDSGWPTLP